MQKISAVLVTLLLAGCAGSVAGGDLEEIQKRGVLRTLTWSDNLDELFSVRSGTPPGLEREILQGFAELHRLRLEPLPVDDPGAALLAGSGDLVAGGFVATQPRRQVLNFTSEVFPIRHVVVTYHPHAPIGSLEALRKARVATQKGTSWAEQVAAAGVPPANVDDSFGSPDGVLRALRGGAASATVMSVVWAMVEHQRDPKLELGMFVGPATSVGFAVRRDQPQLLAALDAYLANVRRTPTWSRLVVKYFGESGLEILRKSRE